MLAGHSQQQQQPVVLVERERERVSERERAREREDLGFPLVSHSQIPKSGASPQLKKMSKLDQVLILDPPTDLKFKGRRPRSPPDVPGGRVPVSNE